MRVHIRLAKSLRSSKWVSVEDALVDTGATLTTIPRAIAEQLELEVTRKHVMHTASGEIVLEEAGAVLEYNGEASTTPVLISDDLDIVLIGVVTLETMALAVDPKSGQLIPSPMYLL